MTHNTTAVDVRFGKPRRISASDSRLIAYGLDAYGEEDEQIEIRCAIADSDLELSTIESVVGLCNARREIIVALLAAERLLDSVAYVASEADTAYPLYLIRAAIASAQSVERRTASFAT